MKFRRDRWSLFGKRFGPKSRRKAINVSRATDRWEKSEDRREVAACIDNELNNLEQLRDMTGRA